MSQEITAVVFRTYRNGEVVALFPYCFEYAHLVGCYSHVGQHSNADYHATIRETRPATEAEYLPLMRELEGKPYGYKLRILRRANGRQMLAAYNDGMKWGKAWAAFLA